MIDRYDFYKTKYGIELLIDLIKLESLEKYILNDKSHILSYYDITLILDGEGSLILDNNLYDFAKHKIFCSSPMQIRQWNIERMPKGLVLIFEEDFLSTFFSNVNFVKDLNFFHTIINKPTLLLSAQDGAHFEKVLLDIEKEILNEQNRNNHILRALLYQALAWLDREYTKLNKIENLTKSSIIQKFKNLVNDCFKSEHTVKYYANKLNITSGYLNELVKRHMRISAKQFIQNRVFLEAKRLLCYSSYTISEISWKLGFQDEAYFTRAFKSKIGYSPKTYRNLGESQKVPL